jgi:hypothetical protein
MKKYFLLCFACMLFHFVNAQQNKGLCKVEVYDVTKVISFGYLVGYTIEFKNNANKTVDGIYWTVNYYNNSGDLLKTDESSFNSTNVIEPIGSGHTKILTRAPRVKGASKISILISKVHYSDGSSCK